MNKKFKEALEAGLLQKATYPDGTLFKLEGVQYYQATDDGFNMATGRFHALSDTIRSHDSLKLTGELLETALKAIIDFAKTGLAQINLDPKQVQDNLRYVITHSERLLERMKYGVDMMQLYEIASIFYFTEQEDPATIDRSLNYQKIQTWLRYPELYGFFLATPFSQFVPLKQLAEQDTLSYMGNLYIQELLDWKIQLLLSGPDGMTSDTTSAIQSRMETLQKLSGLLAQL